MQHRERVLDHIEYSQERLRTRRAELAAHLCALNKSRRNLKSNPFLRYVFGYTREAATLLGDIQSVRRELSVIETHKQKLQDGHHPWYVIGSMRKQLPRSAHIINRLELAALGVI